MKSAAIIAASLVLSTAAWSAKTNASERLSEAANVFNEVMSAPDRGIPQDVLAKSECVIIVPSMKKAAFVVGGEYGRGFAECRSSSGTGWTAPAAVRMEGGSVGFQIGGSATDMVLLVMNRQGMDKLLGDKFTLGADASIAAGPVGRTAAANTDARMTAEILSWSRAKGLFAGISLNGATLRPDTDADQELYGRMIENREILTGNIRTPSEAHALNTALDRYASRANAADREKR
jgi:lipid-binding SYLF domain-containing protein